MGTEKSFNFRRVLMMFILILAGSAIYELPYLRYYYYDVLKEALELNNTELGTLMSVYGFVAMLCYFPGGWLADRISSRKLIAFSLISTGLIGFYFSTFPGYYMQLAIHVGWAATTTLTFWAALIKGTRQLGDSSEQGRLFGILEGGRGLLPTLYGFLFLALFNRLGASVFGLRWLIFAYAGLAILAGILTWFLFEDDQSEVSSNPVLKDILKVIRIPGVWLIALIIFSSYVQYTAQSYITPYLTEIFGASVSLAAALALIRTYVLAIGGGPLGGFVADKVGSSVKVLLWAFIMIILSLIAFLLIPGDPAYLWVVLLAMVLLALSVFVTRGIYFAAIDEISIPLEYTGAAVGFASLIGFMPEAFIYTLFGSWMDANPGVAGYKIMFSFMTGVSVIGFITCGILLRKIKKDKGADRSSSTAL